MVIVGLEASGYSTWFEQMLEGFDHEVRLGDAAEVRRRTRRYQKNDRRDAKLILDLLPKREFPQVHRTASDSREVLRLLRHPHRLVQTLTMVKNSLQAGALSVGSVKRS